MIARLVENRSAFVVFDDVASAFWLKKKTQAAVCLRANSAAAHQSKDGAERAKARIAANPRHIVWNHSENLSSKKLKFCFVFFARAAATRPLLTCGVSCCHLRRRHRRHRRRRRRCCCCCCCWPKPSGYLLRWSAGERASGRAPIGNALHKPRARLEGDVDKIVRAPAPLTQRTYASERARARQKFRLFARRAF